MKTRTKFLLMLLVLLLALALAACGGEKNPAVDSTKDPEATKTPVTTEPPVVYVDPFKDSKYKAEDYYALYVQDDLLLHLNFAKATEATAPLVGGESYENPNVSAQNRFTGAPSNYNPFVAYTTVENPVNGGTAKIIAPWYFENWYKDGFFNTNVKGNGKVEDMQTEEPLEYAKEGNRNGTKVYIRNTNMYHTDFYYNDGVWARQTYASYWGDGFFGVGKNGILNVGRALNKELVNGYTVDIAFDGPTSYYYIGVRIILSNDNGSFSVDLRDGEYIQEGFAAETLTSTAVEAANTLSLTVETTENSKASFTLYGNGVGTDTQTLAVAAETFENLHQFCAGASDLNLYAVRLYNRALTAEEVAQNHFADIAIQNKLDIEGFLKLDDAGKLKVYEAFKGEVIDGGYDHLQPILDAAVK